MVRRKNRKTNIEPRYELPAPYEDVPESYWAGYIKNAKNIIKWDFPCYVCCIKSSNCWKISDLDGVQEDLEATLKTSLDLNLKDAVKDSRMDIMDLVLEALILRDKIKRCIYVQKDLTKEGYPIWTC